MQSCKFSGDAESPELQVVFYLTPISYDLLYEVDDRVAKQLFRKEGKDHVPAAEIDDVTLKLGELGAFNLELFPHNQEGADDAGQMIPHCTVTKVEASKLFKDKNEWSLLVHMLLPMDSHSLELMRKHYKKSCFLTFVPVQDDLLAEATIGATENFG